MEISDAQLAATCAYISLQKAPSNVHWKPAISIFFAPALFRMGVQLILRNSW